jgi:hypothetical protein
MRNESLGTHRCHRGFDRGLLAVSPSTTEYSSHGLDDGVDTGRSAAVHQVTVEILRSATSRARLASLAEAQFGDVVKAVVDVRRRVMAIGGELHSDEEAALIEDGGAQEDLWGINLYPAEQGDAWIEFDSMINVRPSQGNRSRNVEDSALQALIRHVVTALVEG